MKLVRWVIRNTFGFTVPFLKWVEPSFTGNDRKASGRKLSACVFMVLISTTTSKLLLKEDINVFHIYLLVVLVSTFLLLIGILTAQNLMDIWKNGNGKSNGTVSQPAQPTDPEP